MEVTMDKGRLQLWRRFRGDRNPVFSTTGVLVCLSALFFSANLSFAEDYPNHPIHFIVPFSGGSSPDGFARFLAEKASPGLKQPIVVELRPGANSILGTQFVANSAPDGYTILFGSFSHTLNPGVKAKLPYDSIKDFVPVAMVGRTAGQILVVRSDFPAKTLAEFVALAKANPGKYSYAHAGVGNVAHIAGELLKKMAGIDIVGIPYTGSNFGMDVLGGQVDSGILAVVAAQSLIKDGKLRGLALTGPKRTSSVPDVPTFKELGYQEMDLVGWFGLWAPAKTPKERVDRLANEVEKALNTPETAKFLDTLGMEPSYMAPEPFARFVDMDIERQKKFLSWIGFIPQ
jgi:tripartite-type tricarboxylate transporter receptor subunit TctC